MNTKGAPITPADIPEAVVAAIPPAVFDVWNHLIVKCWAETPGRAKVMQDDVVTALCISLGATQQDVFTSGWLNIEEAYRKHGWVVVYDKPAYCESYAAYYVFTKK